MSESDTFAAALDEFLPCAIEPQGVMVLFEDDQRAIVDHLYERHPIGDRVAEGDEYANEVDELVRITLRKRRLEEEVRRINKRIAAIEPAVVEQMTEQGLNRLGHEATGATLRRKDKAWIKYADDSLDTQGKAAAKAYAGQIMVSLGGDVADLVKPDYNSGTVSAFFRERYIALVDAEQVKPEHERRPVDPDEVIPPELRVVLRLDAVPHIEVRS